jgi:hypothetical protein
VPPTADRRSFVAHDADGGRYLIVATRPAGRVPGIDRPGPWAYRTLDGRDVRPADCYHLYSIEVGDIRLTTSDPDEPTD